MAKRTLPGAVVPATRDWERTTYGAYEKRVLRAMAEAFFTDPDEPADRGARARFGWLVDDVDDFISQASPTLRWGTRVAVWLVDWLPLFFIGRFSRCENLPLDERERYLATVEESPLPRVAVLVVMFKTLMTILYFEHPEAAPVLGYDGRHERFRNIRLAVTQPELP